MRASAEVRFDHYTQQRGPGCWIWTGPRIKGGYGRFRVNGRKTLAHRYSYEKFIGPIPDGLDVCHTCDNPPCQNPEHFFPGTNADNNRDKVRKGRNVVPNEFKTHCKRGHEFTIANTLIRKTTGNRACRTCVQAFDRNRHAAKKARAA